MSEADRVSAICNETTLSPSKGQLDRPNAAKLKPGQKHRIPLNPPLSHPKLTSKMSTKTLKIDTARSLQRLSGKVTQSFQIPASNHRSSPIQCQTATLRPEVRLLTDKVTLIKLRDDSDETLDEESSLDPEDPNETASAPKGNRIRGPSRRRISRRLRVNPSGRIVPTRKSVARRTPRRKQSVKNSEASKNTTVLSDSSVNFLRNVHEPFATISLNSPVAERSRPREKSGVRAVDSVGFDFPLKK